MPIHSIEIPESLVDISSTDARELVDLIDEFTRSLERVKQNLTTIAEASGVPQYYYSAELRARGIPPVTQGQEWETRPYPGYGKDDSVTYLGQSFVSTMPFNIFKPGHEEGVAWTLISGGGILWRSGVTYSTDDLVRRQGKLWKCLVSHNSTADGPSSEQSAMWQDMGPS